jgi:hypothetical protein
MEIPDGGGKMTPGQLVRAVSIALNVPEETVTEHDRNLIVAGLRTKGGRGRSAPQVTPLDAARLLVAVLGSIRTKDSVDTVGVFEQAILVKPMSAAETEAKARARGLTPNPVLPVDALEDVDPAIRRLPDGHNLVEGLAAVITEASLPIDDLQGYLRRFSHLGVSCNSNGYGGIGGLRGHATYLLPHRDYRPRKISPKDWEEREYSAHGVDQDRRVRGTAVMLLGSAFRDNGLQFSNPREAYLAGYGTKPAKTRIAKSAPAKRGR